MRLSYQQIRRAGSAAFGLAGFALMACAGFWPTLAAQLFYSPLAATGLGAWCCGSAVLLHPQISAGIARGFWEFRQATKEVTREIRGDDDDDHHPPAT